jgi:Leucine-rich repeat (LRR) protein
MCTYLQCQSVTVNICQFNTIYNLPPTVRVEENSFQDLWDLEKIYLSKNGISAIYRDTFRNLPSLEKLYLDDNLIKDIGTEIPPLPFSRIA